MILGLGGLLGSMESRLGVKDGNPKSYSETLPLVPNFPSVS